MNKKFTKLIEKDNKNLQKLPKEDQKTKKQH